MSQLKGIADKKVWGSHWICWNGLFGFLQTTCDACKPNLIHVSCLVKLKLFWLAIVVCVSLTLKQGGELKVLDPCGCVLGLVKLQKDLFANVLY